MLVYGDLQVRDTPPGKLAEICGHLDAASAAPAGIVRHAHFVAALIAAGELAQGLADAAFAEAGRTDVRDAPAEHAMALTVALARTVAASWQAAFALPESPPHAPHAEVPRAAGPLSSDQPRVCFEAGLWPAPQHEERGSPDPAFGAVAALAALAALDLPAEVTIRQPEGFAHYALYPEAYLAAAADLAELRPRIIGIRSIGTTLAAMLAAGTGGAVPPATFRPIGHPYRREVSVADALADHVVPAAGAAETVYAIADEGPGFSGSSFASVAAWLEGRGVPLARIHLVPSHGGAPGPQADPAIRRVWDGAPRHVHTFDDLVLAAPRPAHRLESWVADLVGPATAPLFDLSGGAWREGRPARDWPPVLDWQEKRKFRLETAGGSWLLRFAGLGRVGLDAARRAAALSEAGFTPAFRGWRHGFTVERWHAEARPLDLATMGYPPVLRRIGAYLGFRARHLPPPRGRGAGTADLFAMARHNVAAACGEAAAAALLEPWRASLDRLEARRRPIATDNRMHAWEWLVVEGRLLKTDALDHHAGHDLVGPQDVAWDVAGAAIELCLDADKTAELAAEIGHAGDGHAVDADLLAFYDVCYAAFQLGSYVMAAGGAEGPGERDRLNASAGRYRARLDSALRAL